MAWSGLPGWARRVLALGGLLLVTAAGVQWEGGAADMGFAARFALHGWILAAFTVVILSRKRIEERLGSPIFAWTASFVVLVAAGLLTDAVWL